jgi:acetolactate synthase small subunit
VWAIDGDGCFQMTNQELATCAINNIPIKVALINNSSLGMVRQWQTLFYNERYSNTDLHTSHTGSPTSSSSPRPTAATACGRAPEDVDAAIEQALAINDRPVVIDFVVHRDAMVWPMVPAGTSNDKITPARDLAPVGRRTEMSHATPCPSSSRTSPACSPGSPRCSAGAASTSSQPRRRPDRALRGLRMTVVVDVEELPLEQVTKQLNKLVNVLKIVELEPTTSVQREIVLVKVRADNRPAATCSRRVSCSGPRSSMSPRQPHHRGHRQVEKLQACCGVLEPFGIKELVQSGMVAVGRGPRSITDRALRSA